MGQGENPKLQGAEATEIKILGGEGGGAVLLCTLLLWIRDKDILFIYCFRCQANQLGVISSQVGTCNV